MDMMKQDGISLINKIATSDNLKIASKKVYQNKGAAGIDGVNVYELNAHPIRYGKKMIEKMKAGTYQPQPVKQVSIPKDSGGTRNLGIPVVHDRVVQQAILQVVEPIIDPSFSNYSYGFRKGRNAHQAIKQASTIYQKDIKQLSTAICAIILIRSITKSW